MGRMRPLTPASFEKQLFVGSSVSPGLDMDDGWKRRTETRPRTRGEARLNVGLPWGCADDRFLVILEGRRIAPVPLAGWGRKVRTPQGAMPRNPDLEPGIHAGGRIKSSDG